MRLLTIVFIILHFAPKGLPAATQEGVAKLITYLTSHITHHTSYIIINRPSTLNVHLCNALVQ